MNGLDVALCMLAGAVAAALAMLPSAVIFWRVASVILAPIKIEVAHDDGGGDNDGRRPSGATVVQPGPEGAHQDDDDQVVRDFFKQTARVG